MKTLELEINNNIAYLKFNRPKYLNSYNWEMSEELPDCLEKIAEDNDIRLLVISGNGNAFMAGGDVNFLKNAIDPNNEEYTLSAISHLNRSIEIIKNMNKIVISAVHGAVAGAGLSIMLATDLVVCDSDTKFNLAYIKLGLSPDGGISYLLPRVIGSRKAAELFLLSDIIAANDASKLNLVNFVFDSNEYQQKLQKLIKKISKGPKFALDRTKMLLNNTWNNNLNQQQSQEAEYFIACCKTEDFKLGIDAFLNKEQPEFL